MSFIIYLLFFVKNEKNPNLYFLVISSSIIKILNNFIALFYGGLYIKRSNLEFCGGLFAATNNIF